MISIWITEAEKAHGIYHYELVILQMTLHIKLDYVSVYDKHYDYTFIVNMISESRKGTWNV